MKFMHKKKTRLIAMISALVFFLSLGVAYTVAWFEDAPTSKTSSVGTLNTNGLKTDALVYSGNGNHTNDDTTARGATQTDEGGTYGYDHSQNGKATAYYIMLDADGNGSISYDPDKNLQMFTNVYNADDDACYFKLSLKGGDYFKIYDSDLASNLAESWFGYNRINGGNAAAFANRFNRTWPFEDGASDTNHDIKVKSGTAAEVYDIYFNKYSGIWIDVHIDETTEKVTSTSTGYYIVGDSSASSSGAFSATWSTYGGYAMYIDTTRYGYNKGVYIGLYLEPGDLFKITTKSDSSGYWYGFSDVYTSCGAYGCFEDDASGDHNIKCKTTGYYNIYITTDSKPISIERFSGSYTSGGNNKTAKGKMNAAAKTTNPIYWRQNASSKGNWGKIYSFGGNTNNGGWPGSDGTSLDECYKGYLGDDNKFDLDNGNGGNGNQTGDTTKSSDTNFYFHNATGNKSPCTAVTPVLKLWKGDSNNQNWSSVTLTYTRGTGFTYTTDYLPSGTQFNFVMEGWRNSTNGGSSNNPYNRYTDYLTTSGSDNNYHLRGRYKLIISLSEEAYAGHSNWMYALEITFVPPTHWTVHYDANGGSFTGTNDVTVFANTDTGTTKSYTPDYTNISKTGYAFSGWKYNGNTYSSGSVTLTGGTTDGTTASFVAQWSESTYYYYFASSANSWATDLDGDNEKSVGSQSSPGAWVGIVSDGTLQFKIFRRHTDDDAEWNYSCLTDASKTYCTGSGSSNITISTAGTYQVSLDKGSGKITVAPMTYKLYQYESSGGSAVSGFPKTATLNASGIATFDDVVLTINKYWHIESAATSDDAWGWNTSGTANIHATTNYASFFEKGDARKGTVETIWNIKNRYTITADIEFNKEANTITLSDIRASNIFTFKQSTSVGGNEFASAGTTSTSGTVVTINNASLSSGRNCYLDVTGGTGLGWSKFYVNSAYPSMKYNTNTTITNVIDYFYTSNNNVGIKYGGSYNFTYDLATGKFETVYLNSLLETDFKFVVDNANPSSPSSPTAFTSRSGYVWTKTSQDLSIGGTLYIRNDNTGSTKNFVYGSGLTIDYGSYSKYFTTNGSGYLKSLVDCTISFTFTFNPVDATGTLTITSFTKNETTITHSANSTVESGFYWLNSSNSYAYSGSAVRMFYSYSEGKYAYSGLRVTDTSTTYLLAEAYKTAGTGSGQAYQHLYEHLSAQTLLTFSRDGSSFGKSDGKDDGYYVQFASQGTYDIIIYEVNSTLEIEVKFSGKTVNTDTEHEGKWQLIGKGTSPASYLYDCDFTTNRSKPMYCVKGNGDSYPCYAGKYGGDGDPGSTKKGTTILLMDGDQLALNTNNTLMTPASYNSTYVSLSGSVATIKKAGYYYVYATNSTFTIEFSSSYDGRTATDYDIESSDISSSSSDTFGAPAAYTKLDGARVKRASGNSLSFATGINASVMDASDGYIHIYVELRHINKSNKAGTLAAALSSVTAPTGTKYSVTTYSNKATPVQSALSNIASLRDASAKKTNADFADGTMFSNQSVAVLDSNFFSVATIIEIKIPISSASITWNTTEAYGTFVLKFNIALTYTEA